MIEFEKEEKDIIVEQLQHYLETELAIDIGQFDTEFLLDYFSKEVGVYFYNRGLSDAQKVLNQGLENISDAIYQIEKPTKFDK